jgi:cyclophilin family peptidyl-prolyl cis-trans isomerase
MITAIITLSALPVSAGGGKGKQEHSMVFVKTSMGNFTIELFDDKAPVTVENFLNYVDKKFYNGTIFHRVISTFVIQGGGFTKEMSKKDTAPPIKNEAANGVKNLEYTLSMARTGVVDSATSQFFISVNDNPNLDHKDKTDRGFGYAVFGKVVEGMDVIDQIKLVKTTTKGSYGDVPVKPVIIKSITRIFPEEE